MKRTAAAVGWEEGNRADRRRAEPQSTPAAPQTFNISDTAGPPVFNSHDVGYENDYFPDWPSAEHDEV